jgi:hypothetical protein
LQSLVATIDRGINFFFDDPGKLRISALVPKSKSIIQKEYISMISKSLFRNAAPGKTVVACPRNASIRTSYVGSVYAPNNWIEALSLRLISQYIGCFENR